jgi:cell division transport system permease protein
MWTSIKRIVRSGFTHCTRGAFVSLASVLIMTVTLFTIGGVIFLMATLTASLDEIKSKVDVNVYFQTGAKAEDILALAKSLESLPEVQSVEYLSREQALLNFKTRHENDELTLQAHRELPDNPRGAVVNIRAKEPSQYAGLAEFLRSETALHTGSASIIDEVNYYDNKDAIDKLSGIIESARTMGFSISFLLVFISLIIALNTIRLAIYISRDEIGVMRLVGASNMYIRGPFVVSGILYGFVSAILTLAAYVPITYYLGNETEKFFSGLNLFQYYLAHFVEFLGVILLSGVVLGAFASFLAVRRYLNV